MPIIDDLKIDKELVEKYLRGFFLEDTDLAPDSLLSQAIYAMIGSGGKRLRPALLITGAKFGKRFKENEKTVYRASALIEAIHLSSLVHDDIIDKSETRRNRTTIYAAYGSRRAAFAGSYIFSRAAELLAEYAGYDNYININSGLRAMCRSEIRQMEKKFDFDIGVRGYLENSKAKTANLISACLYTGAVIGGADKAAVSDLKKIGMEMGIVFQIVDDILDFTQDSMVLGKPSGSDLINGNITLPLIYAMNDILRILPDFRSDISRENLIKAVEIVRQCGAVEKCYEVCRTLLDKANERMKMIPSDKEAKDDLENIMTYFYSRKY